MQIVDKAKAKINAAADTPVTKVVPESKVAQAVTDVFKKLGVEDPGIVEKLQAEEAAAEREQENAELEADAEKRQEESNDKNKMGLFDQIASLTGSDKQSSGILGTIASKALKYAGIGAASGAAMTVGRNAVNGIGSWLTGVLSGDEEQAAAEGDQQGSQETVQVDVPQDGDAQEQQMSSAMEGEVTAEEGDFDLVAEDGSRVVVSKTVSEPVTVVNTDVAEAPPEQQIAVCALMAGTAPESPTGVEINQMNLRGIMNGIDTMQAADGRLYSGHAIQRTLHELEKYGSQDAADALDFGAFGAAAQEYCDLSGRKIDNLFSWDTENASVNGYEYMQAAMTVAGKEKDDRNVVDGMMATYPYRGGDGGEDILQTDEYVQLMREELEGLSDDERSQRISEYLNTGMDLMGMNDDQKAFFADMYEGRVGSDSRYTELGCEGIAESSHARLDILGADLEAPYPDEAEDLILTKTFSEFEETHTGNLTGEFVENDLEATDADKYMSAEGIADMLNEQKAVADQKSYAEASEGRKAWLDLYGMGNLYAAEDEDEQAAAAEAAEAATHSEQDTGAKPSAAAYLSGKINEITGMTISEDNLIAAYGSMQKERKHPSGFDISQPLPDDMQENMDKFFDTFSNLYGKVPMKFAALGSLAVAFKANDGNSLISKIAQRVVDFASYLPEQSRYKTDEATLQTELSSMAEMTSQMETPAASEEYADYGNSYTGYTQAAGYTMQQQTGSKVLQQSQPNEEYLGGVLHVSPIGSKSNQKQAPVTSQFQGMTELDLFSGDGFGTEQQNTGMTAEEIAKQREDRLKGIKTPTQQPDDGYDYESDGSSFI